MSRSRTSRSSPSIRRCPPSTRSRGSTACARSRLRRTRAATLLEETLGFVPRGDDAWEARGATRGGLYAYDEPPAERGLGGAGTVHHIAWSSSLEEHEAWHERSTAAGMHPSPIIDRFWFRSIYFREPSGVLFEIATLGPGFSVDEDTEHLGETLILPPAFEHLRAQVEPILTPLPDPRPWAKTRLTQRVWPCGRMSARMAFPAPYECAVDEERRSPCDRERDRE